MRLTSQQPSKAAGAEPDGSAYARLTTITTLLCPSSIATAKCWSSAGAGALRTTSSRRSWLEASGKPEDGVRRADEYPARQKRASEPQTDPMKSWRNGSPLIRGTPVDHYLRSRGTTLTDKEAVSLRFSPALWHWPTQSRWPAMLARVSLATGIDLTTHQTFLKSDGSGKAPLGEKARLFAAGGCTLGGGVWFGEPDPLHEFIVGEGIESTLSALRIFNASAGCAALSELGVRRLILAASSAASSHIRRQRRTRTGTHGCARGVAPLASGGARGRGLNRGSSWGRRQRRFDATDGSSWLMTSS